MIRTPAPEVQRAAQALVASIMADNPKAFVAAHKALQDAQREAEKEVK